MPSKYHGSDMSTRMPDQPRQRWQLLYARVAPALFLRQADLLAAFEHAFTTAGLPVSRSNAKRPKVRIAFAASPPAGIALRAEVLEVYFDELVPLERLQAAGAHLPDGVSIVDAREVWHGFPSAASQLRAAEYEVEVRGRQELTSDALRGAVVRLLATESLPDRRRRGESERRVDVESRDLRPLIEDIEVLEVDATARTARLRLVLRTDASAAGRPEDVVRSLDLALAAGPTARTRLLFVDTPPIAR